jgi:macrolide-specific efflux system membrane fusion protein
MNNNVQAQVLEGLEVGERVVSADAAPAAAAPGA